eukprot:SM000211S06634  [mRNA]  locus=s211:120930:122925:+ [translate_table: standard]
MLRMYDEVLSGGWPNGGVDLLICSGSGGAGDPLLHLTLRSVELLWPAGLGDVVLVLDAAVGPAAAAAHLDELPAVTKVVYGGANDRATLWADNFTTASDATGRSAGHQGHPTREAERWRPPVEALLGAGQFRANFGVTLPLVLPRATLPRFRAHVAGLAGTGFSAALAAGGGDALGACGIRVLLGNYLWHYFHKETTHLRHRSACSPPPSFVPSLVDVHQWLLPSDCLAKFAADLATGPLGDARDVVISARFQALAAEAAKGGSGLGGGATAHAGAAAAAYIHEGLCSSFPPRELLGCGTEDGEPGFQGSVWQYGAWMDWRAIATGEPAATALYDGAVAELWAIYRRAGAANAAQDVGRSFPGHGRLASPVVQPLATEEDGTESVDGDGANGEAVSSAMAMTVGDQRARGQLRDSGHLGAGRRWTLAMTTPTRRWWSPLGAVRSHQPQAWELA